MENVYMTPLLPWPDSGVNTINGTHTLVPVVRRREATDPPSPFHGVPSLAAPDQKVVERYREGVWVEGPKSPFGQVALEGKSY